MRIFITITVLIMAAAIAEENAHVAKVIDNDIERMPSHTVAPEYPRKARRDRIEGEVMVCFEIDRRGKPRRIAVRRSTNRQFEKPSLRAVRASSFKPLEADEALPAIKSCRTFLFMLVPAQD